MKHGEKKALVFVVICLVLVMVAVSCTDIPPPSDVVVELTEERIARGKYLVEGIAACSNCHTPGTYEGNTFTQDEEKHLAGGFLFEEDGFGTIYARNITQDVQTGIGGWTDGEIIRAIREGVSKDGSVLISVMPYPAYKDISDNDVMAIVAYLRTIKPVSNKVAKTSLAFPLNILWPIIGDPNPAVRDIPDPPTGDPVEQGKYLVALGDCVWCHTPAKRFEPDMSMLMAGGKELKGPWGTSYSANLTPDPETGLTETDDEIVDILRYGTTYPPMSYFAPYHKRTREEDLRAVIAYLRTLPPIVNKVPEPILPGEGEEN